jgi:hypothetical protein
VRGSANFGSQSLVRRRDVLSTAFQEGRDPGDLLPDGVDDSVPVTFENLRRDITEDEQALVADRSARCVV